MKLPNRDKYPFNQLSPVQFKTLLAMNLNRDYTAHDLKSYTKTMLALKRYGLVECVNHDQRGKAITNPCNYLRWKRVG
jgi:hypothetical protein